jgi:hypothetical protein
MAGVIIDAYRMRPTKDEWNGLLHHLSGIIGRDVKEFHTKDFYAGNSPWRNLPGPSRVNVISAIFEWYAERRHQIVYSVIDKHAYEAVVAEKHPFAISLGTLWRTLAMHVTLSIQKYHQRQKKNKGNTLLIFDAHENDKEAYSKLVLEPPDWTETYYKREKKQNPLDQIIDVPHFVDSAHVGMIQLADCISYILRRHVEIQKRKIPPKYDGEEDNVKKWAELALGQSISRGAIYPQRGRSKAADYFCKITPDIMMG